MGIFHHSHILDHFRIYIYSSKPSTMVAYEEEKTGFSDELNLELGCMIYNREGSGKCTHRLEVRAPRRHLTACTRSPRELIDLGIRRLLVFFVLH